MLVVSLLLAGLAMAISALALSLAVYHDLRDRNSRIRPRPHAMRSRESTVPTMQFWERAGVGVQADGKDREASIPLRTPDIVVGPWTVGAEEPGSRVIPPPRAA